MAQAQEAWPHAGYRPCPSRRTWKPSFEEPACTPCKFQQHTPVSIATDTYTHLLKGCCCHQMNLQHGSALKGDLLAQHIHDWLRTLTKEPAAAHCTFQLHAPHSTEAETSEHLLKGCCFQQRHRLHSSRVARDATSVMTCITELSFGEPDHRSTTLQKHVAVKLALEAPWHRLLEGLLVSAAGQLTKQMGPMHVTIDLHDSCPAKLSFEEPVHPCCALEHLSPVIPKDDTIAHLLIGCSPGPHAACPSSCGQVSLLS